MASRRVRTGARYVYRPVPFDVFNPPFNVEPGDVVTVIRLPGDHAGGTRAAP